MHLRGTRRDLNGRIGAKRVRLGLKEEYIAFALDELKPTSPSAVVAWRKARRTIKDPNHYSVCRNCAHQPFDIFYDVLDKSTESLSARR